MRRLSPEAEGAVRREIELGAGHLELADARGTFFHQDPNGFLVAERGTGGKGVLRMELG